ncbi:MAG: Na/Pi symporter [Planctomycetes bacterium]|nr:Na/Pi symporter [Planctomycetota bacterium]
MTTPTSTHTRDAAALITLAKVVLVFVILYLFLVGIGSIGGAFKIMGKGAAHEFLASGSGPVVSLFIGILATTLVQSSSTTTSLVVGLVATGAITFDSAIYMVMGANVGTTVTNTIVSLGHITRSAEYQRAFAAATVHDFFNLIVLAVVFPLEIYTRFLTILADDAVAMFSGVGGMKLANPIKTVTKPAIELVQSLSLDNGVAMALLGVALTFGSLYGIVKLLRSLVISRLEALFDRTVFRTPFIAMLFGLILTVFVQSSSITTSVVVPLVGAGVLTVRQVFPFTMGANIGTTVTAVLASLAAAAAAVDPETAMLPVRVAFHHVLFNVFGVAMLWFCRGIPIAIATRFADLALRNRLVPIVYILVTFYIAPFLIILLGR